MGLELLLITRLELRSVKSNKYLKYCRNAIPPKILSDTCINLQ